MPDRPLAWLLACLLIHALLAATIPLGWWVPNLTTAALTLAVASTPQAWFIAGVLAGCSMLLWSVRHAAGLFLGCLALAAAIAALTRRWDVTGMRMQVLLVSASTCAMTGWLLCLEHVWSWSLLGWASLHVAITTLTVPLLRPLLDG